MSSVIRSIFALIILFSAPAFAKDGSIIPSTIKDAIYLLQNGILQNLLAKEVCSCVFVAEVPLETCKARANLPGQAMDLIRFNVDTVNSTLEVRTSLLGDFVGNKGDGVTRLVRAKARFRTESPQLGCQLVTP